MKSKINVISTLFIVAIAMSASYSQSKHTAKITSVPIKTQNLLLNSKMSNFKPEIHGLKFVNDIHWELPLIVAMDLSLLEHVAACLTLCWIIILLVKQFHNKCFVHIMDQPWEIL